MEPPVATALGEVLATRALFQAWLAHWIGSPARRNRPSPAAPQFSRPLARGLGLAEDPANGESFGMSRCRVAAEGLWNAFVTGANDAASRQRIVSEHAARAGLDPQRPWLNPGSTDAYHWEN